MVVRLPRQETEFGTSVFVAFNVVKNHVYDVTTNFLL